MFLCCFSLEGESYEDPLISWVQECQRLRLMTSVCMLRFVLYLMIDNYQGMLSINGLSPTLMDNSSGLVQGSPFSIDTVTDSQGCAQLISVDLHVCKNPLRNVHIGSFIQHVITIISKLIFFVSRWAIRLNGVASI